MPRRPLPKLNPAELRKAYKKDLAAAWALARRKHPSEVPYAFVLWGVEGGEPPSFLPVVLTEEGLTKVAGHYLEDGRYDTLEEARTALRYAAADSPNDLELEGTTPTVDALVDPHAESLDDGSGYALLANAAIAALKDLDKATTFAGVDRKQLLLVIVTEDTPKDWSKESARKLNPPSVFKRFADATRAEKGTYASSDGVAIDGRGTSLYSVGSRKNPDYRRGSEKEYLSTLVAYDVVGRRRLVRRWVYETGDYSMYRLACTPDGKSVVVEQRRYEDRVSRGTLMRFPRNSSKPSKQVEFTGGAAGLAVSPDGTRVALTTHDNRLELFDGNLRHLRTHKFRSELGAPLFLNGGKLLVATDRGLVKFTGNGARRVNGKPMRLRGKTPAVDAKRSILAVGHWSHLSLKSVGVTLLRLPSLKLCRKITLAGYAAVMPTLSPDGRLLAFEAHAVEGHRSFIAVFDTQTGREVARRRFELLHDFRFMQDGRTLALASTMTVNEAKLEPITFWDLTGAFEASQSDSSVATNERRAVRPRKRRKPQAAK